MAMSRRKKAVLITIAVLLGIPLALFIGLMVVVAINVTISGAKARVQSTTASLAVIRTALQDYELAHGASAPSLAALATEKLLAPGPIVDAWGRPFVYTPVSSPPPRFIVTSLGEDGLPGTSDDITAVIP